MLPVIVVQLGRIGDILNIMPPCKLLGIENVLINEQFSFVLKGQSYLKPWYWNGDMEDLSAAVAFARGMSRDVRVAQLFGRIQPHAMPPRSRPSFTQDQWDRIHPGLGIQWGHLPLEFDRRDYHREERLRHLVVGDTAESRKPMVLVNLFSHSSPMNQAQAESLWIHFGKHWLDFNFVNLANVRAEAYCDLLGLYEEAVGLITTDTASLHLCQACPELPCFQFIRGDRDASPLRDRGQPYGYGGFDKIDEFIASLQRGSHNE